MKKIWQRLICDLKQYRVAIALLGLYFLFVKGVFHASCPTVIMTGIPCPGCGLTRSVLFLLTGQVERAFVIHPLGIFWLTLLLYWAVNRYFLGRRVPKHMVVLLGILALATIVLYFYRMAVWFPDKPPMSYTGKNMMEKIIPGYRTKILSFF